MLKRLKVALVRSYVGAILIGWLAAQGITDAVNIFATPVMVWISRQLFPEPSNLFTPARNLTFPYLSGLPPLIRALILLAVAFLLLHWLYFEPAENQAPAQPPDPGESA